MTYDEAIAFWFARANFEVRAAAPADLKLERMRALLRLLGDPHDRLRIVHVTGTKGKGSTCAMLAAVLRAAGHRVGLFTSPHLERVEERVQVDGAPISRDELAARMAEIAPAVRELERGPGPPPTFFEISTALGFLHFVCRRVDVAVVEVGLGGRFDSTNVCRPLASVITSVGLDHTAQLGTTLEEITFQKAGIIKPRVPVVSGAIAPGPRAVIERVAREAGSRLLSARTDFGHDYSTADTDRPGGTIISTHRTVYPSLELGLLGEHQAANAAVAAATVEVLRAAGLSLPVTAVIRGLRDVCWPARVGLVARRPAVVLDTAHNVPSAEALVATLRTAVTVGGQKAVVFAVSADKDYRGILRVLAGYFDHLHLTRSANTPRGVPPDELAAVLAESAPWARSTTHPTAAAAWAAARSAAGPDDLVCVTGSFFLAGEVRPLLPDPEVGGPVRAGGNTVDSGGGTRSCD